MERKTGCVKKIFLAILLAAAVSVSGIPAFAAEETATGNSVTISLSTLDGLIRQYNTDALSLAKNLTIAREAYKEEKGTDSVEEEELSHEYDLVEATYEENVQQVVLSAKQAYLECWHDASVQAADQAQADRDAKLLAAAAQQLQNGYISQKDYQSLADQATQSSQALQTQIAATGLAVQNLKAMVPVAVGISVKIAPVSDTDFDFSGVSKIVYSTDKSQMLYNSEDIKEAALEYTYENSDDYGLYTDAQIDAAKLTVDQTTQQQESAFLSLYNTVTASYAAYQTELQTVQRKEAEVQLDAQRVAQGYLSQKSYDQDTLDLQTMQNSLESDRNSLFLSYLKYVGMKNGYSAGSSNT